MGVISGHQIIIETKKMMELAISNGQSPVFFHMNDTTLDVVDRQIRNLPENQPSKAQELLNVFRKKAPDKLTHLHGVPIQENPRLPDGVVSLQVGYSRQVPNLGRADLAQTMQNREENPFVKREKVPDGEASESPDMVRMADLAGSTTGPVTPADVIMKAMEDIDDVDRVIIIRIHKAHGGPRGDVDMSGNANLFEMKGIIADAQDWLARRGE